MHLNHDVCRKNYLVDSCKFVQFNSIFNEIVVDIKKFRDENAQ